MDEAQLSLPGIIPGEIPQQAIDVLAAARKHAVRARLTDAHMAVLLNLSIRQWQRLKHDLRSGRWGGYDWLEGMWPLTKDWHPSWERLIGKPRAIAQTMDSSARVYRLSGFDINMAPVLLEVTFDEQDNVVSIRPISPARNGTLLGHLSALAAGISTVSLLDIADGHLDGVLHWCYVLLESALPHARLN